LVLTSPPFCSQSATAASTKITPIPASQRKSAHKPIFNGDSTAIRTSVDAAALENSDDDDVDNEGGYDFFGELPNPDPEDVSPRDLCGDFILLFAKSKKIAKDYSKDRKVRIFYDALTVDKKTILGDSPPKDVKATFELWRGQVKNRYKWNLDRIAEAVFVVSKHASNHQEMNVQRGGSETSDERVIALVLMYRTIMHEITIADAARISHNKAAAKKLEQQASRSRQTKPLPANFRYDANKVCCYCSITTLALISQRRSLSFLFSLLGC
jgi:hypothetical protein